jgi:hypothetical protein
MSEIQKLVANLDKAQQVLAIHKLRGAVLERDRDTAIAALQEACRHDDVLHETSYHSGGYDYCATTDHTWTCKLCGKLIKHDTEMHHGRYG